MMSRSTTASRPPRAPTATEIFEAARYDLEPDRDFPATSDDSYGRGPPLSDEARARRFWTPMLSRTRNEWGGDTDGFSFRELIGDPRTLHSAVVLAFVTDVRWVAAQFPKDVHVTIVMGNSRDHPLEPGLYEAADRNDELRNVAIKLVGRRWDEPKMHVKLFMYFHSTFLRVVIPSANASHYDWRLIDNAVWVMDLPILREIDVVGEDGVLNDFRYQLERLLSDIGLSSRFYQPGFKLIDFRIARDVKLVLSLPDRVSFTRLPSDLTPDDVASSNGHVMLSRALRSLGLTVAADETLQLEIHTSTIFDIPAHGIAWIKPFWRSACGLPLELDRVSSTWTIPDELRLIFPTEKTVVASHGGTSAAHTLFCKGLRWRDGSKYLKRNMYDGISRRPGVLGHTKQILGLLTRDGAARPDRGWIYTGSGNFAPGVWGTLRGDIHDAYDRFEVKAWELGVVRLVPLQLELTAQITPLSGSDIEAQAASLVTWQRPCTPYARGAAPWFENRQDRLSLV